MKTSYVFQGVSLLTSLAVLILILGHLDSGLYLQWVLFSTIGGAVIQLENSLSTVVTRFLSRQMAQGEDGIAAAARVARRIYHRFAIVLLVAMLAGGGAYLFAANGGRFSPIWPIEWLIYSVAFFGYYWTAHYSCVLIALQRVRAYALIGIGTRLINFAAAALALMLGYGILGLSIGVGMSFAVGAVGIRAVARRALVASGSGVGPEQANLFAFRTIFIHAAYAFGAYSLYRVGLMIQAAISPDTALQASAGLALQIYALIMILAAVPLNMRVTPLVAAVVAKEPSRITGELAILSFYTNGVYAIASALLLISAGWIGHWLPDRGAQLPAPLELGALAFAFLVQVNIFVIVNVLLASQRFRFAIDFCLSALAGLALGCLLRLAGLNFYVAFIIVPALTQLMIALPLLWRRLQRETGITLRDYAGAFRRHMLLVARHPIRVGLAMQ